MKGDPLVFVKVEVFVVRPREGSALMRVKLGHRLALSDGQGLLGSKNQKLDMRNSLHAHFSESLCLHCKCAPLLSVTYTV